MAEFELLLIGISMILATAFVHSVKGLYHATVSPGRYWIPQVFLWSTLVYCAHFLWAFKDNIGEDPTYLAYMSSLAGAASLVLRAYILSTNEPAQIENWRDHFDKTARSYFVVSGMTTFFTLMALVHNNESTGFDAQSLPFYVGGALYAIGAISNKVWVRGTVAVIGLLLILFAGYFLFSNELV
ncbi:hypothetical protein RHODOSMS8_02369 [Rhodobiaceae bacterium]|nr:hypothetical protein RHODOSMS8_02369 [Rhodobiaceae bacterium]